MLTDYTCDCDLGPGETRTTYLVTGLEGQTTVCRYCPACAELALCNWTGETPVVVPLEQATHDCGGTILSGGTGAETHRYCDRCGAFRYATSGTDVPSGQDREQNSTAWNGGLEASPAAP